MSIWTHPMCDDCWALRPPPGRRPARVHGAADPCCWCGTTSDVYVRQDPDTVPCLGVHPWEET